MHAWNRDRQGLKSSKRELTVLQSLDAPDGTTKYVVQISEGMPDDIELKYFSWRAALIEKYDVFHVHWPEFLMRARSRPRKTAKTLLFVLLTLRLTIRRTPVVRTLHNLHPHETGGRIESTLLSWLDRRVTDYIRLNPMTVAPTGRRCTTILHGHYKDWFTATGETSRIDGRILNFGLIRPYKGVEELLDLVKNEGDPEWLLRIVGKPIDERMRERILEKTGQSTKISLKLQFVSDEELVDEILQCELVVLPYRSFHNSGVALLSLSMGRPILVPGNDVSNALRDEVGDEWVHTFEGTVKVSDIRESLYSSRRPSAQRPPELSGRDWATVGLSHREVYRTALCPPMPDTCPSGPHRGAR
ncbi:glycosyltransferase [Rhodococcoides yunnanense]|uniref:glycosyltransferase n=1 Tax=Rhodococcoides yunnanense TaxID=278209 RepID=UPI0022B0B3A5|nr:glycosyltransferase [Rhodococcus yunnanensis]MCZ4278362.1 hypothetical protein [Rhodococcus yunnanensis]